MIGIFPDKLKITKVVPLYKKGENTLFSNYRPLSILPSLSEIFEQAVYSQLYAYFESNKFLYSSQYSFRQGHSTEFAALELLDKITVLVQEGKVPVGVFLDMSIAFDTLNHDIIHILSVALCRCHCLSCGFEPRLVQDFQRNIMFLPSQSWDIVSMLCSWERHFTLKCST